MNRTQHGPLGQEEDNAAVFEQFNTLLTQKSGIYFPQSSINVLKQRVLTKVRMLQLPSMRAYYERIIDDQKEFDHFLDFVTTNLSYFYREAYHYNILEKHIIPQLQQDGKKNVRIWSAGCSTGEEPYTLAMLFAKVAPGISVHILGTDISQTCIGIAEQGIYPAKRLSKLPLNLRNQYMKQLDKQALEELAQQSEIALCKATGGPEALYTSRDRHDLLWRVEPVIRAQIHFLHHNLCAKSYQKFIPPRFDLIFCRNVLIYFPPAVQEQVVNQFNAVLAKDGWLFLGHSELIDYMDTVFVPSSLGAATYRLPDEQPGHQSGPRPSSRAAPESEALKTLRKRIRQVTGKN